MKAKLWLLLVTFMNLVIRMTYVFMPPYALSLHYRWAKMLWNSIFVSLLNFNLESILAYWLIIACIVVNIG